MTIKEELRTVRKMQGLLDELIAAKDRAYLYMTGKHIDYSEQRVQTSPGNSEENRRIQYISLCERIDKKIDELIACQARIFDLLTEIHDNTLYEIMVAYYVNCETWQHIAERINYSVRQVHRLHGKALAILENNRSM